jgi:transposase
VLQELEEATLVHFAGHAVAPLGTPESARLVLAGDTARAATSDEVKVLRKEARDLKEVVAEQALELRILKKSMIADGGDDE